MRPDLLWTTIYLRLIAHVDRRTWRAMDNDLLMSTLNSFFVVIAVATMVAGPLLGLFGFRLYKDLEATVRRIRRRGSAECKSVPTALFAFAAIPAMMFAQLIANSWLLVNHHEEAEWGWLIGIIVIVVGVIAVAIESHYARTGTTPRSVDIATNVVDLDKLRTLAEELNTAYCIRYHRLARMSEEDRKTRVGLELAHVCGLLENLTSGMEKVVGMLDGSEKAPLAEIKAAAAELLEWIEDDDETIPLKGVTRQKLIE
jgi:hypothetical protein